MTNPTLEALTRSLLLKGGDLLRIIKKEPAKAEAIADCVYKLKICVLALEHYQAHPLPKDAPVPEPLPEEAAEWRRMRELFQ